MRLVRNGRRIYGGIYRLPSGKEIYVAFRKQAEIFRSGEKSIADAMQKGVACWVIDNDTLIRLRIEGVYIVGVQTKETGDCWFAMLGDFLKAKMLNFEQRGGALQRYLPFNAMTFLPGTVQKVAHSKRPSSFSAV